MSEENKQNQGTEATQDGSITVELHKPTLEFVTHMIVKTADYIEEEMKNRIYGSAEYERGSGAILAMYAIIKNIEQVIDDGFVEVPEEPKSTIIIPGA